LEFLAEMASDLDLRAKNALVWFAAAVASSCGEARANQAFIGLYHALKDHPGARELNTMMSGAIDGGGIGISLSLGDVSEHAGGRHDNDKPDFRSIAIMPTIEEVLHHLPWRCMTHADVAL
jgi:hypothetical protein